jgi:hypothetical protein
MQQDRQRVKLGTLPRKEALSQLEPGTQKNLKRSLGKKKSPAFKFQEAGLSIQS